MDFFRVISSFLLLILSLPLGAQEEAQPETGLVLSGGGALGLAHIGVLQYLEEIEFPIDQIGGTSMGGIVGGLYALGYSADELAEMARSQDWSSLLSNRFDRRLATLEARQKQDRYLLSLNREKDGISLGNSLVNGINVYLFLKRKIFPYSPPDNFEELNIPFYCVSVDLNAGEPVILDRGDLTEALLATMAVPGVFAPIEKDGQILVDGGLLNNFPVREMRSRGARRVLGVRFQYSKAKEMEGDLFSILNRSYNVLMKYARPQFEGKADIQIEVQLEEYSFSSFDQADSLIHRGYLAAREHHEELIRWCKQKVGEKEETSKRGSIDSLFRLNTIQVSGNERLSNSFIRKTLGLESGQECSYEEVEQAIRRLQAGDEFDRLFFSLEEGITGTNLDIRVEEKTTALMNVGLRFDTDFGPSILLSPQLKDILASGSLLRMDIRLNNNPYVQLDFQINSKGQFTPFIHLFMGGEDYFDYNAEGSLVSTRQFNQFTPGLGIRWNPAASIRASAGFSWQSYGFTTRFRQFILDDLEKDLYLFFGNFELDNLDRNLFPERGVSILLEAKLISENFGDEEEIPEAWFSLNTEHYVLLAPGLTFCSGFQAGYGTGFIDEQYLFYTGGLYNHLRPNLFIQAGQPLMNRNALKALAFRAHFRRSWQENHHIWVGYSLSSTGNHWRDLPDRPISQGFYAGYGFSTSLGPLEALVSTPVSDNQFEFLIRAGFRF